MKIVIHTMYFLPEFGSAPILMNELASYLASRGHSVEVITTIPRPPHYRSYRGRIYSKEFSNGFCVKRFRTNFTRHHIGRLIAWTIYTGWSIINILSVQKGNVVFLRLPPLQLGIAGFIARKLKGAKVLLSVQDIHPDLSIESGLLRNPRAISLARLFEKWIYRNSDEIIVISDGFKKNLEAKDTNTDKLSIIPNWVDTDFIKPLPKKNHLARKFSLDDKFVIMYSGTITLSSYLSLEKVLSAVKLLKSESDLRFVIVGEGLKRPELIKKANELGLENVIFLPFQPYNDLPNLLAASDILLVPLDKKKTQLSVPSKLYNYMAAGRPILGLADDESEVARIIKLAKCGINAEPGDVKDIAEKIMMLKNSEEEREISGRNARTYCVENYSKDYILRKYEELILSLGKNITL